VIVVNFFARGKCRHKHEAKIKGSAFVYERVVPVKARTTGP
jgi:hypothetical protein